MRTVRRPTSVGKINFQMHASTAEFATYSVTVGSTSSASAQRWSLRWPGVLHESSIKATGCTIVAVDTAMGIVTCTAHSAEFHVAAQWSPARI